AGRFMMEEIGPYLCLGAIIFGVVVIILGLYEESRCPQCRKPFQKGNQIDKQETSRKKGYKTITREEKNREGDVVRQWQEQVRILTVNYLHTYQCRECGHMWTKTSSTDYDTFDD